MSKRARTDIYPDTDTFICYNANPKNRITGDCTFRAISTAMEMPWNEVVMEMAELSCDTGYAINDKKGIERYLTKKGWVKMKQPRRRDNTKYTGKEFIEEIVREQYYDEPIIVSIGGHHLTCVCANHFMDIWDCTDKSVGNYWIKRDA